MSFSNRPLVSATMFSAFMLCFPSLAQTQSIDENQAQSRGIFVALFVAAFAPSIANSVGDWIGRKISSNGQIAQQTSSNLRLGIAPTPALPATLALVVEAHQVSASDELIGKLTRFGSDSITLSTGDRFVFKFSANMPGLLRVENVDAKGTIEALGEFAVPAGEDVVIPEKKAFRMVGTPGTEALNLTFFPCRAYSAAQVRTRGLLNDDQVTSMVQSNQQLMISTITSVRDCGELGGLTSDMVAVRGVKNENFAGGIATTSSAVGEDGKILPVKRKVTLIHKPPTSSAVAKP